MHRRATDVLAGRVPGREADVNRFLLFCFDDYYPGGGFNDYVGSYLTQGEALAEVLKRRSDQYQIVDTQTGAIYRGKLQ